VRAGVAIIGAWSISNSAERAGLSGWPMFSAAKARPSVGNEAGSA